MAVSGTINIKNHLKGNPQIKLALNETLTVRKGNTLRGEEQLMWREPPSHAGPEWDVDGPKG